AERLGSVGYRLTRRWDHRGRLYSLLKLMQHEWNYGWLNRRQVIDTVICPSRFVQRMLAGTGLRTSWLPHPAPRAPRTGRARLLAAFSELSADGPAGGSLQRPAELRYVFAGRIEPEKGLYEFLQALPEKALAEAQLTIIGRGTERARCERYVSG